MTGSTPIPNRANRADRGDRAADADVIAALRCLRDAGLVTDRDQLNRAWAELTGRTPTERNPR